LPHGQMYEPREDSFFVKAHCSAQIGNVLALGQPRPSAIGRGGVSRALVRREVRGLLPAIYSRRQLLAKASREHVIALEPRGKGLLGVTLHYPYERRLKHLKSARQQKSSI
jgi:hypothetical protein